MAKKHDFEQAYLQYSDKIYRFLYFHTRDSRIAEDLASVVFVRAWKSWDTLKPDFIQAWLYKIANNILIDFWRKNGNKRDVSYDMCIEDGLEPSYDTDFIEKIDNDAKVKRLNEAMGKLPNRLKKVIVLRFIEEMSAKEVADILDTTEVNVRVLQHRALLRLKGILKNED